MADDAEAAAADKARAEAEARRQRILDKSKERIGFVSGDPASVEAIQEEQEEASAPSRSRRMQAMRRRRFKKKQDEEKAEPEKKEEEKEKVETPEKAKDTVEAAKETTTSPTSAEESDEPKKKYKGVAKMRREMLQKKQEEQAEKEPEAAIHTKLPYLKKSPVSRLPIVLHLVAVLLLFVAGLDIGWNQLPLQDVMIHRQLSPMEHGIAYLNPPSGKTTGNMFVFSQGDEWSDTQEEFDSPKEDYVPNIDPLFQVDLDQLTKGDGIFLMLARGAVAIHRWILYCFLHLPRDVARNIASIPQKLVSTPPILCLVSLAIRQCSKLLGGKLPTSTQKEGDVLSMMKNGILNFLATSFPTAVTLYDTWTHLRSDMYVILCGVFVGLAYTHRVESMEEGGGTDEL